jgi:ABC-type multidrug transport system fused ATPase/permease subunit
MQKRKSHSGQDSEPRLMNWSNISVRYFAALCLITALMFLFATFSRIISALLFTRASTALHNNMFQNVIHAPLRFFNVNPIGIILNRFSKDMSLVDNELPEPVMDAADVSPQK